MKNTVKIAVVAALAAVSLTAAAKLSEGKAYGDWKGTCQGNECGAVQIVNNPQGEPVGRNAAIPLEGNIEASVKKGNVLQVAAFVGDKQQTMGFSLKGVSEVIKNL